MKPIEPSRIEYFTKAYDEKLWGGGSGVGSRQQYTSHYRQILEGLLQRLPITSVLDIGCGDGTLYSLVHWGQVQYTGIDIVPEVVTRLSHQYGGLNTHFFHGDVLAMQVVPPADLLIAKDVLQHWTDEEILRFLPIMDRYRFALITNDIYAKCGQYKWHARWRPVDLRRSPFNRVGEVLLENRSIPDSPPKVTMLFRR